MAEWSICMSILDIEAKRRVVFGKCRHRWGAWKSDDFSVARPKILVRYRASSHIRIDMVIAPVTANLATTFRQMAVGLLVSGRKAGE